MEVYQRVGTGKASNKKTVGLSKQQQGNTQMAVGKAPAESKTKSTLEWAANCQLLNANAMRANHKRNRDHEKNDMPASDLDISHFQFHCLTKKLPFARNQLAGINNNRSVAVFNELLTTMVESLNAIGAIWLQRVHILEAEGEEMPFLTFETRSRFCFLQSRAPWRDRDLFTYSQGSRQAQDFCSLNLRLRDKIKYFCHLISKFETRSRIFN